MHIVRPVVVAILVSSIVTAGSSAVASTGASGVALRSRTLDPPADPGAALRAIVGVSEAAQRHVIVQLARPPAANEREALDRAGIRLLQYLPENGWFASVRGPVDPAAPGLELIRSSWTIEPRDRLAAKLAAGDVPAHAVAPDGRVELTILSFPDVALQDLALAIEARGGSVRSVHEDFDLLFAVVPRAAIDALSDLDGIEWIEPIAPRPQPEMNRARAYLDVEPLQTAPYGLTGSGVSVSVHDYGHAFQHADFASRWTQGDAPAGQTLGTGVHASMTAGTIAGDGTLNADFKGMATAAQVYTYSYESPEPCCEANNYGDVANALSRGLDIANDSWGYAGCHELPYGEYTSNARVFDLQVLGRDSNANDIGDPTIVVFSAGNERAGFDSPPNFSCIPNDTAPFANYGTLNQPKPAKNTIVVGAVDSIDGAMTQFSSWGPTSDGRLRPDFVAAGVHGGNVKAATKSIDNCYGVPEGGPNQQCYRTPGEDNTSYGGYAWFSQTSSAAAMTSGAAALLVQDFRAHQAGADPWPSTVKAHFVHTARDLDDATRWYNRGPDYASGYGVLDARAAVDQFRAGQWRQACLSANGASFSLPIPIAADTATVKVTLAWDDPAASPVGTGPALVNDLDLTVTGDGGATAYPWTLDPANPADSAVRTAPDRRNNVEQVVAEHAHGAPASWTATVTAHALNQAPQCFSLLYSQCSGADADGDGRHLGDACGGRSEDCDDHDASIHPGAPEACNGRDDDCDGALDEGCDGTCDNPEIGGITFLSAIYAWTAVDMTWNPTSGRFATVWVQHVDGQKEVVLREKAPSGEPAGPLVTISQSEVSSPIRPRVVWSGSAYGVVWGEPVTPFSIFFRSWSESGATPVRVVTQNGWALNPAVAWSGETFGVTWTDSYRIFFQLLGPDGSPIGAPRAVETAQSGSFLDLAWTGSDWAIASHRCASLTDCTEEWIQLTRVSPEGRATSSHRVTGLAASPVIAQIAWNGDGFGLVWQDRREPVWQVYFSRTDAAGSMVGSELLLSAAAVATSPPSIAWSGGEYGVVYEQDGWNRLSLIDPQGQSLGTETLNALVGDTPIVAWTGETFGIAGYEGLDPDAPSIWLAWERCCDDADFDGATECEGDCDEASPAVYPGAPQLCDGINNDCADPQWPAVPAAEADYDLDGVMACAGDCNDYDLYTFPGATEICDVRDNDCDGPVDEGFDDDLDGIADCLDACPGAYDPGQPVPAAIVAADTALLRIELATGATSTVASSLTPQRVSVNRAGATALVTQTQSSGSLASIDLATGAASDVCVGLLDPTGVDYASAESDAYVGRAVGKLLEIELATCRQTTLASSLGNVGSVRRGPDGQSVYLTDSDGGRLLRKRLDTGAVEEVATGLGRPLGLDLDAAGTTAYVAENSNNRVAKIDLATGSVTALAPPLANLIDVRIDPSGLTLYVLLGGRPFDYRDGSIRRIDLGTGITRMVESGIEKAAGFDLVHRDCPSAACHDLDADGYGSPGVVGCPSGPLPDCDDNDARRHPGAAEICDGLDDDCDGVVPADELGDVDADGVSFCSGDCNDVDASVKPGAAETCNGRDDDCDGLFDEGCDGSCDNPEKAVAEINLTPGAVGAANGRIAWNGTGYGLVWSDQRDGNPEIYFALLDAAMNKIGMDLRLTNAPGASESPWIVWTGREYGIAFEDARDGNTRVFFARVDSAGGKLGTDHAVAATEAATSRTPRLVWTGREFGLFWNDNRDGSWENLFRTIDADGNVLGTPRAVSTPPYDSNPCQVAWTGSEYAVTYNDNRTGDFEIYVVRLDASGFRLGTEQRVTYLAGASRSPSIVWRGVEYGLFWVDNHFGPNEMFYARLASDGTKIGGDVRLMAATGTLPLYSVAWTGSEYGLAWIDTKEGNAEVYFERIDTSGAPVSPEVRVTNDVALTQTPSLQWTGTGYGLVVVDARLGSNTVFGARLACCDDADVDGSSECHDCNDANPAVYPGAPQACDGLNNDCADPSWPAVPANEVDGDVDGWRVCAGDCDDADSTTYPGAVEANDGRDNQCPGDPGYGTTDEVSGVLGFRSAGNDDELTWDAQPGATLYEIARADDAAFTIACSAFRTSANSWTDTEVPPPGGARFYLVRAAGPRFGSWGVSSSGAERHVVCEGEDVCDDGVDDDGDGAIDCEDSDCGAVARCVPATFAFLDGPGDDIARTALRTFFLGLAPAPTDFIRFEIAGGSPTDGAWCAVRADWYVATYLTPPGAPVSSGAWNKWSRPQSGAWTGPTTAAFSNTYGAQGATGPYSWLSEQGLGGLRLQIIPGNTNHCEAVDANEVCNVVSPQRRATLTIKIGKGKLPTCGF